MASRSAPPQSVHDFTVNDIKGNDVDLSIYKRKVLVIVNVASQWLEKLCSIISYNRSAFEARCVEAISTYEEIQEFACTCFKAEYPIFDKLDVNGANAAPIYKS